MISHRPQAKLKALPITVSWHGSSDDDILLNFDRWAEINIDMDTAAKAHLPPIRVPRTCLRPETNRSRSSTKGKAG
jgi:hypothetical protein